MSRPNILRGAFVEFGLTIPPLIVVFQFNPIQLERNLSLSFDPPGKEGEPGKKGTYCASLSNFHKREKYADLLKLQKEQYVRREEETINFEIKLDATDKLNEGSTITEEFGIAPQLATLELMMDPKEDNLFSQLVSSIEAFSFTGGKNPPMILFVWGRWRILPVNINSMKITETDFNTNLNPIRATISVNLTVIEGPNVFRTYTKAFTTAMSVLNIANIITSVKIPG